MSGRTRKVAEAIGSSLHDYDVTFKRFELDAKRFVDKIKQLDKVENNDFSKFEDELNSLDVEEYDLIIIGGPNYGNIPPKTVMEIINRVQNLEGKPTVVFVTARFTGDKALKIMKETVEEKGAKVVAEVCYRRIFGIRKTDGIEIVDQL